ncbi:MAG: SDR family NAD(P)-dependent oxidoreductase [Deltaproteobacteria bacterium]|nr:SDR family NAD(P)-dependent oxidoreductase [Deltaproteobacteria bacterium]
MEGKICAVTGANTGIGKGIALGLADRGARVLLVCRNQERGEVARRDIVERTGNPEVELVLADLSALAEVRRAAAEIRARCDRLDVLVNNAAVVTTERVESVDGNEMQLAVNHLAYFLLTHELLDLLKASAPARIVNVSALAYRFHALDLDDLHWERRPYRGIRVYTTTKLLEVIWTFELARRLEGSGVAVNCLHPGVVATEIARNWGRWVQPVVRFSSLFMLSPEKGARTALHLATSPEVEGITGCYFERCRARKTTRITHDRELAKRVWEATEELCGI